MKLQEFMRYDRATYLGDGVYVGYDSAYNQSWLGTSDGEEMTNLIAMGPEEAVGFVTWVLPLGVRIIGA